MGVDKNMMSVGGNPQGFIGRIAGFMMNQGHKSVHIRAISQLEIKPDDMILDVGCGAGNAVKIMSALTEKGKVCGVDHSSAMVKAARKLNRHALDSGKAEIQEASVDVLPYEDETIDAVTAFETIQFWPEIHKGLSEIKRVLKPDGRLLIVNRLPPTDSKWCAHLQLKSKDDYASAVTQAGYRIIALNTESIIGWITVKAGKE